VLETPEKGEDSAPKSHGLKELAPLTPQQKGLNYLINYLGQLTFQEDILMSNRLLKQSPLFSFSHVSWL